VLAVLAATLILPALAASIDAFARARRRRAAVGPWLAWIAVSAVPFLAGYVVAKLLGLLNATPEAPPAPVAPDLYPLDAAAVAVLATVLAAVVLLWVGLRRFFGPSLRKRDDRATSGAGVAIALVLSVAAVLLWLLNPFAALLAVPAVHLWILALLVDPPPSRRVRFALVSGGLVAPGLIAVYGLFVLGVNPLGEAWYLLLLTVGGQVGPAQVAVVALFLAALGSVVAVVRAAPASGSPSDVASPTTRGPVSYAGPGSLGGTESALRR
jgi:hypothetical protein